MANRAGHVNTDGVWAGLWRVIAQIFLQNPHNARLIGVAIAMNCLGLQLSINGQSNAGIGAAHVCDQIVLSHSLFPILNHSGSCIL